MYTVTVTITNDADEVIEDTAYCCDQDEVQIHLENVGEFFTAGALLFPSDYGDEECRIQ